MEKHHSITGTSFGYIGGAVRNQERKDELPKAVDLSHHLSELAENRHPSSLKSFYKYWRKPGVIGLAGGIPPADYFPFDTLEANTLPSDMFAASPEAALKEESLGPISWLWSLLGTKGKHRTEHIKVAKYASDPSKEVNLASALQYSLARAVPQLQDFIQDYSTRFFDPAYADFVVLVHGGNTDGWNRVTSSLLNKGDGVLVEEFTYPNALSTSLPLGANVAGIPMDSHGMRPDALEEVLANWNEEERGFRRPHLLYTVGVGQNPSGLTTGAQRKKEIYEVCVKYDVIICEDDPYYILQAGDYIPKKQRVINARHASTTFGSATFNSEEEIQEFIDSLVPSYLKFDYQGRVIRLDTFSKTIAPGSRLGWFTCSPQLAERFERQGEVSTQSPCGFGQSLIAQLLTKQWGLGGYVRWLRGIRTNYTIRRDALVDVFMDKFDITSTSGSGYREGAVVYDVRFKQLGGSALTMAEKKLPKVMSFIPPTGGMFLWLEVHFDGLPLSRLEPGESHETRFWAALADKDLLVLPGWLFNGEPGNPLVDPNITGHYRISFSDTTNELMKTAVDILAKVLEEYFKQ